MELDEMIPKQKVITYVLIALVVGFLAGRYVTNIPIEEETESLVDLRLAVNIGDKIIMRCDIENKGYNKCSTPGWVMEAPDGNYKVTWDNGQVSKHCSRMLAEESIKHPNNDYFLHNITFETYDESVCED